MPDEPASRDAAFREPLFHETEQPEAGERSAILAALVAANERRGPPAGFRRLALLLKDANGATDGGMWAGSFYDWMFVELLVVPERLRGQGVGTALMRRMEAVAAERGCAGVWLDTFGFQAPGFYARLGYEVFGTLAEHPRGGERVFLRKVLG